MKQIINVNSLLKIMSVVCILFTSCSIDGYDDTAYVKNVFKDVCVTWGADLVAVSENMDKYEMVESDEDFLKFSDQETGAVISYLFDEDGLCASSVIISEAVNVSLNKLFAEYEYVGLLNDAEVYCQRQKNIFLSSYTVTKDEKKSFVIGMTKF